MKNDPDASDPSSAIAIGEFEIDCVAIAVFVRHARYGIPFLRGPKQSTPQEPGVSLPQPQCRKEDAGLVSPAGMMRVQAIVAKLGDIDNRSGAAGQLHYKLVRSEPFLADCTMCSAARKASAWMVRVG